MAGKFTNMKYIAADPRRTREPKLLMVLTEILKFNKTKPN